MAQISDFYRDKTVFITGVTGFIGKVLLEKLLRKCSGVKAVYCLVRDKNDTDASQRLSNLLDHQCFDNLWREVAGSVRRKVKAVPGDILKEEFGIPSHMRHVLEENVNVVIHLAGTVKFDEPLRHSLEMNVLAVRRLLRLCSRMENLESLVHMSTAYANCEQSFISEQVYPSIVDPSRVLELLQWLDEDSFKLISSKLIGAKPNTFVYTKHLAEVLLMTEGCRLPISIIRPSIVTAAWQEPMPGWVDSDNGPSSLYVAMGRGLLRSMIADQCVVADVIPVDLTVNMTLVVAWFRAVHLHENQPHDTISDDSHFPPIKSLNGIDDDMKGVALMEGTSHGDMDSQSEREEPSLPQPLTQITHPSSLLHDHHLPSGGDDDDLGGRMSHHALLEHNKHHNNNNSVYHLTTGGVNPFTWGEMEDSVLNYFRKNPLDQCFRRPKPHIITSNSVLHDCWILLSHMVPAYAADLGYLLIGRKPRMVKTYSQLHHTMEVMEYLTTRSWHWTHGHLDLVRSHMSPEDQKFFNFDPRSLHWASYIENSCYGTRKFLLKQCPSSLPAARARLKMLRNLRYVFNTTVLVVLWRVLVAKSNVAQNSWSLLLSLVFKFVSFFRLTSSLSK